MEIASLFYSIKSEGLDKISNQLSKAGDSIISFGNTLEEKVSKPILGFINRSVDLASDINESMNVINVTFGKSSQEIDLWSKNLMENFGLTERSSKQYVGAMGAMLKSSGLSDESAKKMSKSLVELTGDTSSFYNLSHDEMWEKIRAGISGETEPLKVLGMNLSVANLEAHALTEGIKKSWKEMSQAEQVTLRYSYLMKLSKDAQGDFNRTQDQYANKLRVISGKIEEFSAKIGNLLLPYVEKALILFEDWIDKLFNLSPNMDKIVLVVMALALGLAPLVTIIGVLVLAVGGVVGVFSALFALISTVGLPIFAGISLVVIGLMGWLVILIPVVVSVGVAIGGLLIKTGFLKDAFSFVKNLFLSIVAVLKGDVSGAFDILTEKLGMSQLKAFGFISKLLDLKQTLIKVKDIVLDTGKIIGAMFTGDRVKMMDLLTKKFGLSKDEAKKFADRIIELRDKAIDLYNNLKVKVIDVLEKVFVKLKKLGQIIIDNRAKIIKFISIMVELGVKVYKVIKSVVKYFNDLKTGVKIAFEIAKASVQPFIDAIKITKDGILLLIGAIKSIKFPSPPKWLTSKLPKFATGVKDYGGGWAMVGEEGPELINVPSHSDIYPAGKSRDMLRNANAGKPRTNVIADNGGGNVVNYIIEKVNIDGKTVAEFNSITDFFKKIENEISTTGFSY